MAPDTAPNGDQDRVTDSAATVIHGVAAGAPRWSPALVHIHRPGTHSSGYCGVVLRQRWMAKADEPVTCKKCVREAARDGD